MKGITLAMLAHYCAQTNGDYDCARKRIVEASLARSFNPKNFTSTTTPHWLTCNWTSKSNAVAQTMRAVELGFPARYARSRTTAFIGQE